MTDQTQEQTQTETTEEQQYSKPFVEKVLTEKKNAMETVKALKEKLSIYENQLKDQAEQRLKEQNDWKAVSELKAKEAQEWQQKFHERVEREHKLLKLGAVKKEFEKVGLKDSQVVEAIADIIKLDAIKYDESTNTVVGADEEVKRIKEKIPHIFNNQSSAGVNHGAPQGSPAKISVESYKAMMKDGSWNKMSKQEQISYEKQLWSTFGVERK